MEALVGKGDAENYICGPFVVKVENPILTDR